MAVARLIFGATTSLKQLQLVFIIVLSIGVSAANAEIDVWQEYAQLIRVRHYGEAAVLITAQAEKGDSRACYELAQLYRNGRGVEKNESKARTLLLRAAKQDHIPSQYLLGLFYSKGTGGPESRTEARRWLESAAQQNYGPAKSALNSLNTERENSELSKAEILSAARNSDANNTKIQNTIQRAIHENKHLSTLDSDGNTLLSIAAIWGAQPTAELLLNAGVDINQQNRFGETALHLAVQEQQLSALNWLLSHKASLDLQSVAGKTALHIALERNLTDYATRLLAEKANPLITDKDGKTALNIAVQRQNKPILALLARDGFRPEATNDIERRLKIAQQDSGDGIYPIQLAVERDDLPLIKKLISGSTTPWQANAQGQTLITLAAQHASAETLRYLLKLAPNPSERGPQKRNALFFALDADNNENLQVLLDNGISPTDEDETGLSAIEYAFSVRPESASRLIRQLPSSQWQALWLPMAAAHDQNETCLLFIDQGVDVDTVDETGKTALWYASKRENGELVEILLGADANVLISDTNGDTPVHIAAGYSPTSLEILLRNSDAVSLLNTANHTGNMPLHLAASHSQAKNITLLAKLGADINSRDNSGNTPLMLAVLANSIDTIEAALVSGAARNKRNKQDQDALTMAQQLGYKKAVDALKKPQKNGFIDLFK
ncbi:ankyrin repeat domain-containing protein [Zhongshania sp. BJYM1]|uniref:ankyrin repeat domain-containing protein n=1 Tax=Zhongshania aquatica TaxID=2965069 RepID=UPI0022B3F82D|nr:ankyrin repeat domain-containing protein [Marortus sp. BJYM1]